MQQSADTADQELVVLLDAGGRPCGTALKRDVHGPDTPLHLAFSCYVFNRAGQTLVTRRALVKATWPGVWTNSFCGHPAPGEQMTDAVRRRGDWELGIGLSRIEQRLPHFRYQAVDPQGIAENELCPVFTAQTDDSVAPRPLEVYEYRWVSLSGLAVAAESAPWAFSPWLVLQLQDLRKLAGWDTLCSSAGSDPVG